MIRLSVFLGFITVLVLLLAMNTFKGLPVSNERFDLVKAEHEFQERQKLVAANAKADAHAVALHGESEGEQEEEGTEADEASAEPTLVLDTEELKNGMTVYTKKGKCVTCHGKNGEGKKSQQAPKIAGQYEWYLKDQLIAMKSKERNNPKMDSYLKALTEEDMAFVAHYLSKLPWR